MKKFLITLLTLTLFHSVKAQDFLYQQSFDIIVEMLEGKKPYSFKKAVFSVENAYKKGTLDTIALNDRIRSLAILAESILQSRDLDYQEKDNKNVSKYAALFSVIKDTIPVIDADGNEYVYMPFGYDFQDPFGYMDWENMFVSKLLETKKGNCRSLPYLYKILAEEIGVTAHLALSPNHTYIKHRSERDGWYNTELTSGIFPIDAWLMASGYIHTDAIRNGVYMKALDDKESLALCLVDLGTAYQKEEFFDTEFIIKCADKALEYFPNCVNAMVLKTEAKGRKIELLLQNRGKDFSDVNDYADTKEILEEVRQDLIKIHELGYRQMPEEMYLEWLVSLYYERDKYQNKKINTFNTITD